jgi:cell division protein FtsN
MSARNRGNYSSRGSVGSSGMGLVRGAGILIVGLGLSFALGFFVIARMMPRGPQPAGESSGEAAVNAANAGAPTTSSVTATEHAEVSPARPSTAPPVPPVRSSGAAAGPTIDPDTEGNVQKPGKLEGENPDSNVSSDNNDAATSDEAQSGDKSTSDGKHRKHRKKSDSGALQTPESPDGSENKPGDETPGDTTGGTTGTETTSAGSAGLYHVQIGVFSTREKAEEVAKSANDKGFATTVQAVTRDGHTHYRVQHSAYRKRENAEAAKQRLNEAGFEAYISSS